MVSKRQKYTCGMNPPKYTFCHKISRNASLVTSIFLVLSVEVVFQSKFLFYQHRNFSWLIKVASLLLFCHYIIIFSYVTIIFVAIKYFQTTFIKEQECLEREWNKQYISRIIPLINALNNLIKSINRDHSTIMLN